MIVFVLSDGVAAGCCLYAGFQVENAAFAKGGLLRCKRLPFAPWKMAFYSLKGYLLHFHVFLPVSCRVFPFVLTRVHGRACGLDMLVGCTPSRLFCWQCRGIVKCFVTMCDKTVSVYDRITCLADISSQYKRWIVDLSQKSKLLTQTVWCFWLPNAEMGVYLHRRKTKELINLG